MNTRRPTPLCAVSAAAAFTILALGAVPAHAGRPLQTEDAGVLDARSCEVEGVGLRLSADGQHAREVGFAVGCGIGWNSQLGLGLARTRDSADAGQASRTAQLGGKTSLWRGEGERASAVALAWALGAVRRDGDWKADTHDLSLVGTVPAGPGAVHLNIGRAREIPSNLVTTTWGVAYELDGHRLGGAHWAPMAEVFGDDRDSPWWSLALRVTVVPERVFLDMSYGGQARGERPRLVTAGFKIAF